MNVNVFNNQVPEDALRFDVNALGKGYRLSRKFTLSEAQSGCGSPIVWIHPATILLAQTLRDEFGAIRINSWYRTKEHNERVGGGKKSTHTMGLAIDIKPLSAELNVVKNSILEMNIGGVGFYKTFIHLDVFSANRFWEI